MAHQNTVLRSVNSPDEQLCVDVFQRPDGSFGFEEFRRDAEDPTGWFCIGFHGDLIFDSAQAAWQAACTQIVWLTV